LWILTISSLLMSCSDSKDQKKDQEDMTVIAEMGADMQAVPDADMDIAEMDVDLGADMEGCTYPEQPAEPIPAAKARTPRWAFMPWISKDISDGADTRAFVDGFKSRDIPVGVVVLDSPWETHYNSFIPNPSRYPGFAQMVQDLRDEDIRLVLWVTQMTNFVSNDLEDGGDVYVGVAENYSEGVFCNFYINNNKTYKWWKGRGAAVDFFNPQASIWWHRQQDALLEMGVAGWKLDFGEEYVLDREFPTAAGMKTHQEYSEAYYKDFYDYGVSKLGQEDFLTMVRGWDASYQFTGRFYARPEHAPVVWAGDNRRDWVGLIDALDHMFRSAKAGYIVVGSDLGGYLDRDDQNLLLQIPFDQDNFVRWTALAAMTPFMQLHGRANLAPWTVEIKTEETVAIYRYWAKLHTQLIPLWYSLSEEGWAGRQPSIMRPLGEDAAAWADDWRYMVGDAILVAPLIDGTGKRDVVLPAGALWFDWWDQEVALQGGQTLTSYDATDQLHLPMFVREGAIIPMRIEDSSTGLGTAAQADGLTLLVWPSTTKTTLPVHGEAATTLQVSASRDAAQAEVKVDAASGKLWLRVGIGGPTQSVTVNGAALTRAATRAALDQAEAGFWQEDGSGYVWVRAGEQSGATSVIVTAAVTPGR
jgi:alpha-glucosidase (family GH31 glycosyl hydrolase)